MFDKTITTVIINSTSEMLTKDMPRKKLFASRFLLVLKEKWFSSPEFFAGTFISDKKYKNPRSKYKNYFYFFNNQLDYNLAHYFIKSETIKII